MRIRIRLLVLSTRLQHSDLNRARNDFVDKAWDRRCHPVQSETGVRAMVAVEKGRVL
jgi:hypothetical protein